MAQKVKVYIVDCNKFGGSKLNVTGYAGKYASIAIACIIK